MLIVVRHGRTVLNKQGRLQGRIDAELDEVGVEQARRIAAAVGPVERVVSSPLLRAQQTASEFGVEPEIDDRWIELDYGDFDGQTFADLPEGTWESWQSNLDFRPPGGETLRELGSRVRAAADDLMADAAQRNVVVATHVSPIKASLAWALGVGDEVTWRMFVAQASISRYAVRGVPSLHGFNDTGHLVDMNS